MYKLSCLQWFELPYGQFEFKLPHKGKCESFVRRRRRYGHLGDEMEEEEEDAEVEEDAKKME